MFENHNSNQAISLQLEDDRDRVLKGLVNGSKISAAMWTSIFSSASMIGSGLHAYNVVPFVGGLAVTLAFVFQDEIAYSFLNAQRKSVLAEELGEKRSRAAQKLGIVAKILDEEKGFYLVKKPDCKDFEVLNKEAFKELCDFIALQTDQVLTLVTPDIKNPGCAVVERWHKGKLHGDSLKNPAIYFVEEGKIEPIAFYRNGVQISLVQEESIDLKIKF